MIQPEIIAHRGASFDAPENTVRAVQLAWEQGADAAEVDVHLSRDGILVVMHDNDTCRTTGHRGRVAEMTLPELKQLEAGRWKKPEFEGESIPTLEEILQVIPSGKRLIVEIKAGGEGLIPELHRVLGTASGLGERVVFIAFGSEILRAVKRAFPHSEAYWLQDALPENGRGPYLAKLDELIEVCLAHGFAGLDLEAVWPVDCAVVQRAAEAGLRTLVWTVNDAQEARRLVQAGVHGITTDRPEHIRRSLTKG